MVDPSNRFASWGLLYAKVFNGAAFLTTMPVITGPVIVFKR